MNNGIAAEIIGGDETVLEFLFGCDGTDFVGCAPARRLAVWRPEIHPDTAPRKPWFPA